MSNLKQAVHVSIVKITIAMAWNNYISCGKLKPEMDRDWKILIETPIGLHKQIHTRKHIFKKSTNSKDSKINYLTLWHTPTDKHVLHKPPPYSHRWRHVTREVERKDAWSELPQSTLDILWIFLLLACNILVLNMKRLQRKGIQIISTRIALSVQE